MIFYVPKYNVDGDVYTESSREYFDHSNVCGIDRAANPNQGCVIDLANGRKIQCMSDATDVANAIQECLERFRSVGLSTPISLEI